MKRRNGGKAERVYKTEKEEAREARMAGSLPYLDREPWTNQIVSTQLFVRQSWPYIRDF